MSEKKPLVIVLSRNYSTGLGVIRSLGSAGYTVDLIASVKKKGSAIIASSSKYVRQSREVLSEKIQGDDGSGLIDALIEYISDRDTVKVLFPVDDFTASVVADNRDLLKKHFLFPDIRDDSGKTITDCMDKSLQAELASASGFDVPQSWTVELDGEITLPEDLVFPCFLKPLESISGQKMEMGVFGSEEELLPHLEKMQKFYSRRKVLLQEYLEIEKEYDLCGVSLDQEIIIPALIEKTRIAGYEKGVTMSGKLIPLEEAGDTKEKITDMLRRYHYTGMFDMEFIKSKGRMYFNEINFRSGGPNFSYFLNGANLPAIIVDELTEGRHDKEMETVDQYGRSFVYEKVAWEDHMRGYLSDQGFHDCIENSDFRLLENDDDPAPGKHFSKRIRLSALKHRVLQMAGREKRAHAEAPESDVIITGRNSGNLLVMARDLGKAGYRVGVLRIYKSKPKITQIIRKMKPEAFSRYVTDYRECIADNDTEKVASKLLSMAGGRKLLVPVDDYAAYAIDEHRDLLKNAFLLPGVRDRQGEEIKMMDKRLQKELAEKAGLPVLRSVFIPDGEHIPSDVPYPCFVKPAVSMKSVKSVMRRCEDAGDIEGNVPEGGLIAEEWADIKEEYALLGFAAGGKVTAPCLFRTLRGGTKARKGVAATGVTVPLDTLGDLPEKSMQLISSMGYEGLFDLDYIKDKDGDVFFLEVNFRAGASIHVFTEKGINLAGMMADFLLKGIEPPEDFEEIGETVFASEKVLLEEFAAGDMSRSQLDREINAADVLFIYDKCDIMPYRHYMKTLKLAEKIRRFKRGG